MGKQNPIAYAEDTLNVHGVHSEASQAYAALEEALDQYTELGRVIREVTDAIETREYDLVAAHRGENPDISQAALDRWLKEQVHKDETLSDLHRDLRTAQDGQAAKHAEVDKNKYRLRVLTARMNELGGLLTFLAAAKYATVQQRPEPATSDS